MKLLALLILVAGCLTEEMKMVRPPMVGYPLGGYTQYSHYPQYDLYSQYSQYSQYPQYPYYGGYNYSPYYNTPYSAQTYNYAAAPVQAVSYAPAPALAPAPAPTPAPYTVGSQFHAQDEFGNLNYGYNNINSVKQEVGNTYGGVQGAYSYVDANGELQRVEYVADHLGFRVADSRLPMAPVYDGVAPTFNPEPLVAPEDTAEVKAAKAAHMAALEAAAAQAGERKRREAEPGFAYGFGTFHPQPQPHYLPYNHYNFYNYHGLPYYG